MKGRARRNDKFCLLLTIVIALIISTINVKTLIGMKNEKEEPTQEITEEVVTEVSGVEPIETMETIDENLAKRLEEKNRTFVDRCRITFAEAGNQSMNVQIAVAATIQNREEDSYFPDDFYDVINQRGQFSPVWDGEIHSNGKVVDFSDITETTLTAVDRAYEGEDPTEELLREEAERLGLDPVKYAEGGALYFYNPDYCGEKELKRRDAIKVKVKIGDLVFYKYWDLPNE